MRRSASNYRQQTAQPDNWPMSPLLEAGATEGSILLLREDQVTQGEGDVVNIPEGRENATRLPVKRRKTCDFFAL